MRCTFVCVCEFFALKYACFEPLADESYYTAIVNPFLKILVVAVFLIPAIIFNVSSLRQRLISNHLLAFYRNAMPEISQTERDALEAGGTWWDAELFSGAPDWRKLLAQPAPELSAEEQASLQRQDLSLQTHPRLYIVTIQVPQEGIPGKIDQSIGLEPFQNYWNQGIIH